MQVACKLFIIVPLLSEHRPWNIIEFNLRSNYGLVLFLTLVFILLTFLNQSPSPPHNMQNKLCKI